jgi:hypothetical protein
VTLREVYVSVCACVCLCDCVSVGSSAVSLLREGVGSRGSGLMDLMLLRRVSSLASSTSSLFQGT